MDSPYLSHLGISVAADGRTLGGSEPAGAGIRLPFDRLKPHGEYYCYCSQLAV